MRITKFISAIAISLLTSVNVFALNYEKTGWYVETEGELFNSSSISSIIENKLSDSHKHTYKTYEGIKQQNEDQELARKAGINLNESSVINLKLGYFKNIIDSPFYISAGIRYTPSIYLTFDRENTATALRHYYYQDDKDNIPKKLVEVPLHKPTKPFMNSNITIPPATIPKPVYDETKGDYDLEIAKELANAVENHSTDAIHFAVDISGAVPRGEHFYQIVGIKNSIGAIRLNNQEVFSEWINNVEDNAEIDQDYKNEKLHNIKLIQDNTSISQVKYLPYNNFNLYLGAGINYNNFELQGRIGLNYKHIIFGNELFFIKRQNFYCALGVRYYF